MIEKDLFAQLKSRYDTFKENQGQLEEGVILARAGSLLDDIRNAGKFIIARTQREDLARFASDLGKIIYSISGVYPIMRLDPLPSRGEWLLRLGFQRDPFLYADGGRDPFLQEYFYFSMRYFYDVFDVSRPGTVFVFGPPGSGKSSMRNVISQLCRKSSIFPIVHQDFGLLVRKHERGEGVQVEDHVTQILKTALRTLADLADERDVSSPPEPSDRSRIIRNQLWLYVSKYEDDPLKGQALKNLLKPTQETTGDLPIDAREILSRFCRYVATLFGYQVVYILVDPDDDIAPDEEIAWQVLEPLLSTRRLLELSEDKVAFKFFLDQKFQARALQIPWIAQEQSGRVYRLEWPDEELRALLRERLVQCSSGGHRSLGELSEVSDLDARVIRLSMGSPRELIVICDRLFSEHSRRWSQEDELLITFQEVDEVLKPFAEWQQEREPALEQLIARGESERVEFKSTMRYNRKEGRPEEEMEREVARTMCAFMNTEGGTLIIGVDDNGTVLGLDDDFSTLGKKDKDGFKQAFVNITVSLVDPPVSPDYYTSSFVEYRGKLVYVVQVGRSEKPVFCLFNGVREFYVRTTTIRRKLDVKETLEYVQRRFR